MASRYLHIVADFDENGLTHKIYETLDEFVEEHSEMFSLYAELEQYLDECQESGEEPEYCEKYIFDLINEGDFEGEWVSEKFFEVDFNARKLGVGI